MFTAMTCAINNVCVCVARVSTSEQLDATTTSCKRQIRPSTTHNNTRQHNTNAC
eukprot:m.394318 g.394318  ORF g.394318 m.394318 type:complete len:54 (-) comp20096_c7_seq13:38-199(-)